MTAPIEDAAIKLVSDHGLMDGSVLADVATLAASAMLFVTARRGRFAAYRELLASSYLTDPDPTPEQLALHQWAANLDPDIVQAFAHLLANGVAALAADELAAEIRRQP